MSAIHRPHALLRVLVAALVTYLLLPALGFGVYSNGDGQRFFSLPYLIGFMVIAFFLMHELITPLPPKGPPQPPGI